MFKNTEAFSSFSIDDVAAAREFYGETLGLNVDKLSMGLTIKLSGGGEVFLYPKEDHEAAAFTVLNFKVADLDKAVDELSAKGIKFEQYDGDTATDAKGIMRTEDSSQGPSIAWFKDPAGNFLSVLQER